jgi:hypothetical protein
MVLEEFRWSTSLCTTDHLQNSIPIKNEIVLTPQNGSGLIVWKYLDAPIFMQFTTYDQTH